MIPTEQARLLLVAGPNGAGKPVAALRDFSDYTVTVDEAKIPAGVSLQRRIA